MRRSYRLAPSELRQERLLRPRLLAALLDRWSHRVTHLVAGPGFGKSTLLLQALAENRLAPRGEDVWISLEPQDAHGDSLAHAVLAELAGLAPDADAHAHAHAHAEIRSPGQDPGLNPGRDLRRAGEVAPTPDEVANAVWRRSPTEVCLVFDDVHLLPAGSPGATWLGKLIDLLPVNAHVVLAGRADAPVALTRLDTQGTVRRITEDELRFSPTELADFAVGRAVDPDQLVDSGGWPAVAELAASVDRRLSGAYLWEEVLEPLGPERRHVLGVLSELGGADVALATAAAGYPVDLSEAMDGVPLVTETAGGWFRPHGLWRTAKGVALAPTEKTSVLRRATAHFLAEGKADEAFALIEEAGLWEEAPALLRSSCLALGALTANQLDRWLAASPPEVRASAEGQLARAVLLSLHAPAESIKPLWDAADRLRDGGDVEAELTAIGVMGRLAWTGQSLGALRLPVVLRLAEIADTGHPLAQGLSALVTAMTADFRGDDTAVLESLATIDHKALDPAWDAIARWLGGLVRLDMGDAEGAQQVLDQVVPNSDPSVRAVVSGLQLRIDWAEGRVDEVLEGTARALDDVRASGGASIVFQGMHAASTIYSHVGDVRSARRCLEEATPVIAVPENRRSAAPALVLASIQLAEGEEALAAETVAAVFRDHDGHLARANRHMWRHLLSMTYVLLPETRSHWDEMAQRGYLRTSRELGAAVVALRSGAASGHGEAALRALDLSDIDRVRAGLHHRLAAELAVGLAAIGRPESSLLLDALGPPGRDAVRALAVGRSRQAKAARGLLGTVPAPPRQTASLSVLGPMIVQRQTADGLDEVQPDLGRKRLRYLLAYLVTHRRTDRASLLSALWPDLDERAASNNLAVTLTYVLGALEPGRASGEPAYLVRQDGRNVVLVTGSHLRIDTDEFDAHLAAAARAEADGTPSVALDHLLAAVDLYRGDLFSDLPEADWMMLDREHYKTKFVRAAVRAGELLVGRGDLDEAEAVARRALAADQWSEDAYAVLIAGALANGDRSGARRLLGHCRAAVAEIGVEPSDAIQQLARRVQAPVAAH
jgi:DNA-binding SARP family transcriptional activator